MPIDQNRFRENTIADGHSPHPQNAEQFVTVPNTEGLIDFAVIPLEVATIADLLPIPIRILNGRERAQGGYGVSHILHQHGAGLANVDYFSVQDFVEDVADRFDAVYAGRHGRSMIVVQKSKDLALQRLLVLELSRDLNYYAVVSGWVVSARRPVNGVLVAEKKEEGGVLVWERRAPRSGGPGSSTPPQKGAD